MRPAPLCNADGQLLTPTCHDVAAGEWHDKPVVAAPTATPYRGDPGHP